MSSIHPADRELVLSRIEDSIQNGSDQDFEHRVIAGNGDEIWFRVIVRPLKDRGGKVRLLRGLTIDVSAHRRASQTLQFLADDCIVDVSDDARRLVGSQSAHANPSKRGIFEQLRNRFPARNNPWHPVRVAIETGEAQLVHGLLGSMLEAIAPTEEARELVRRTGARSIMVVPLLARGRTLGAMTMVSAESRHSYNQTDLVLAQNLARRVALALDNSRLYQQTLKQVHDRDHFLAVLGHELRNPLGAISNALSVLENDQISDQVRFRSRSLIRRQVRQLAKLVDDLLDAARISRGKITLERRSLDIRDLLSRCYEISQPEAEMRNLDITLDLGSEELRVHADPTRLEQIINNLLSNALKYTPSGGSIHIEARSDEQAAIIRVSDTGIGIAPEMLDRVFEPFAQVSSNSGHTRDGLGLGLAVARQLAEKHGGQIEVKSEGQERGSEFVLRLPRELKMKAPSGAQSDSAPTPSLSRRRIVIVEDNEDCRESLQEWLSYTGHEVQSAVDGPAGFELIQRTRPEIALVDIGLPGFDGYELARKVRAKPSGLRPFLVAITGYGQPEDGRRALDAGFDVHLVKPVNLSDLAEMLQKPRSVKSRILAGRSGSASHA